MKQDIGIEDEHLLAGCDHLASWGWVLPGRLT